MAEARGRQMTEARRQMTEAGRRQITEAVSRIVRNIGDFLVQEGKFSSELSEEVELLQNELRLILQNELKVLLEVADAVKIRQIAFDADDIIGSYDPTRGGGVLKVLKWCSCIVAEELTVQQFGSGIGEIMVRISDWRKRFRYEYDHHTIKSTQRSSWECFNQRQRIQKQTCQADIVGFDDDVNKLVEFLLKEGEGSRVASICGVSGVGKTTLAKMVYNHHQVKQHFDRRSWFCISQQSQQCESRNVLEGIRFRILKLIQVEKKQKCLVILDDIWNFDGWNILFEGEAFTKYTGSKILITTRDINVARLTDPKGFHHELQCLDVEMGWKLLEKTSIIWGETGDCAIKRFKTRIKEIGKEMTRYCGGLRSTLTVLGGLLATKTYLEWEDMHKYVKSCFDEEQIIRANKLLDLSYKDLPSHLKPCFLYLGLFPKDFEIPTKELIRMWMGEGFISQNQHGGSECTMEDVGDQYLRELVQRCMVLVGKRGLLGRIKTCRVHNLMRDFCISKAQEENLHITNIHSVEGSKGDNDKIQRLAINWEFGDNSLVGIKFGDYPYLKSLLYFVFRGNDIYFKESFFNKFKLVRVLNLENFKKNDGNLSNYIGGLIHLRFLSLKDSNIKKVPSSMGNLNCLQTLDLRVQSFIKRMPNVFNRMKQLRHLYLPQDYEVTEKLELSHLCHLQTLVNVQPKTIQIPACFKLSCLRVLKVMSSEGVQDEIQILISSCPHIEKLNLYHPIPEVHQFSSNLVKLTLRGTNLGEDPMPTLENLTNLKILYLFRNAFVGKKMVCSEEGFPELQSLVLSDLVYLEEWSVKEGAMRNLLRLKLSYCWSLRKISDGLSFIATLPELEIKYMPESFKDIIDKKRTGSFNMNSFTENDNI